MKNLVGPRDPFAGVATLVFRRPSEFVGKCERLSRELITASQTGYKPPRFLLILKPVSYIYLHCESMLELISEAKIWSANT